jgi:hypothetical protein
VKYRKFPLIFLGGITMFKLKLFLLIFLMVVVQVYADGPVTDGLILEMDAANPGRTPLYDWEPSVIDNDPYEVLTTGEFVFEDGGSQIPVLKRADGNEPGKYIWYYDFHNSMVRDIYPEHELVFDYNQPFTVEAWIRVPSVHDDWAVGRAAIIGNTDNASNGWMFGIEDANGHPPVGNQWCIFMGNRDNETSYSDAKVNIPYSDVNNPLDYNDTDWVQIVGTRHGFGFTTVEDGFLGEVEVASVDYSTYINGVKVSDHVTATDTKLADITDVNQIALETEAGFAKLGTLRNEGITGVASCFSFQGDIALVRVYDRELTDAEVATNYNHGIESSIEQQVLEPTTYDLNLDGVVDYADVAEVANQWLEETVITGQYDF